MYNFLSPVPGSTISSPQPTALVASMKNLQPCSGFGDWSCSASPCRRALMTSCRSRRLVTSDRLGAQRHVVGQPLTAVLTGDTCSSFGEWDLLSLNCQHHWYCHIPSDTPSVYSLPSVAPYWDFSLPCLPQPLDGSVTARGDPFQC